MRTVATRLYAFVRSGQLARATALVSTLLWGTPAPMWRAPFAASSRRRSEIPRSAITCSGRTRRCSMSRIRAVPPEIGRASSPYRSSRSNASSRVDGACNWKGIIVSHLARGGLFDGFDDLVVARAAAQVAHHPVLDLVLGWVGILLEERVGGHVLARRADAALEAAVFQEALLNGRQLPILCEALDGADLGAIGQGREHEARADHLSVNQHRAGATDPDAATQLGAREAELVANSVDQEPVVRHVHLSGLAVHSDAYVRRHRILLRGQRGPVARVAGGNGSPAPGRDQGEAVAGSSPLLRAWGRG